MSPVVSYLFRNIRNLRSQTERRLGTLNIEEIKEKGKLPCERNLV